MHSPSRRLALLFALLASLLALPSAAHAAAGAFTVSVTGPGKVTGTGIDCPGDCRESGTWRDDDPPPTRRLEAVGEGTSVAWTGCRVVTGNPRQCEITLSDIEDGHVTAVFTDVQAPAVTITAPVEHTQWGGQVHSFLAAADATDNAGVTAVRFRIGNGAEVTDTTAPFEATLSVHGLTSGGTHVRATAVDAAGNESSTTRAISIDNTPPALLITSGPASGEVVRTGQHTWRFTTAAEATARCAVHRPDTPPAPSPCHAANGFSTEVAGEGEWALRISVSDPLHNEAYMTYTFVADGTAPEVALEGGPAEGGWVRAGSTATFTLRAADANLAFVRCRIDGGTWTDCTPGTQLAVPNPAAGERTLELQARDGADHRTIVERRWKVDGAAPRIALDGPADGAVLDPGVITVDAVIADDESGITDAVCRLAGPVVADCGSPVTLIAGEYEVLARATDAAGHVTELRRRFTVRGATPGGEQPPGEQPPLPDGPPAGPPPAGGPPVADPPAGGAPKPQAAKPKLSAAKSVRLRGWKGRLPVTVRCEGGCTGTVTLKGPRGLSRKATLKRGKATIRVTAAQLRRALGRGSRATLTLRATVTPAGAARRTLTAKVTVRR